MKAAAKGAPTKAHKDNGDDDGVTAIRHNKQKVTMEGSEVQGFGRKLYAGLNCWFFNRTNPGIFTFHVATSRVFYFFAHLNQVLYRG